MHLNSLSCAVGGVVVVVVGVVVVVPSLIGNMPSKCYMDAIVAMQRYILLILQLLPNFLHIQNMSVQLICLQNIGYGVILHQD